jgi:cytochrome c biogenesis protein CcdA
LIHKYKKNRYMKKIKQIIAIMIFLSIPLWMTAQPPHPNNGGGAPTVGGNTAVGGVPCATPIDGGLSILLGLGLAYGARKGYKIRKEE